MVPTRHCAADKILLHVCADHAPSRSKLLVSGINDTARCELCGRGQLNVRDVGGVR